MATAVGSAINNAINGSGGSASATANSAIPVSQMPMGFRPKEYEVQVNLIYKLLKKFFHYIIIIYNIEFRHVCSCRR